MTLAVKKTILSHQIWTKWGGLEGKLGIYLTYIYHLMCWNNSVYLYCPNLTFYLRWVCVCLHSVHTITLTNWCYKMSLHAIYSHVLVCSSCFKMGSEHHFIWDIWTQQLQLNTGQKQADARCNFSLWSSSKWTTLQEHNTHKNIFILHVFICLQWFHFWLEFAF